MQIITRDEDGWQLEGYFRYLDSVKAKLPSNAYSFAAAAWHYDPTDHRCPHDSWVESLLIKEVHHGQESNNSRALEMHLRLLGAYHDGYLELVYKKVRAYSIVADRTSSDVAHGDWLIDELRIAPSGLVVHEIEFSNCTHWTIEFEDLTWEWLPGKRQ